MPYLGRQPSIGRFAHLDDITSSFNSACTTFSLMQSSVALVPGAASNLIISLGGVLQEPEVAYTVAGSSIIFSSAPASTQPFFGILLGDVLDVGQVSQGAVINATSLTVTGAATLSNTLAVTGAATLSNTLAVTGATTLSSTVATGALTVTGAATYTTSLKSTTALATPGALTATQATAFASTVSGAAIMGFGTTNDVSLMNRAGTVVLGVGPNTTAVNMAGTLSVGAVTSSGIFTSTATGTSLFQASNAGGLVAIRINNTDTTSTSSHARLTIDTGTGAGDPLIAFSSGAGDFALGIDNTDDTFQIVNGSALGTTVRVKIDSNGAMTKPAQPAFLAIATASQNNVTGDGTSYTVLWGTEIFDQASNLASPTFTAPVTGRYQLNVTVGMTGMLTTHTNAYIQLLTSNRSYLNQIQRASNFIADDTFVLTLSVLADMDAADTASVVLVVSNATKVVDILATSYSTFSGYLVC